MESIIHGNQNITDLCNKLKSAQVQYPILTKKQERELIEKHRNNRDELNKLLFMHNIRAVFNIAKHYVSKTKDFDGLVQDGMVGLAEAARRFDLNKDIKFVTYATFWIRKYILQNFYGKQVEVEMRSMSLNTKLDSHSKQKDGQVGSFDSFVNDYIDPTCCQQQELEDILSTNEAVVICRNIVSALNNDQSLSALDKVVLRDVLCNAEKPKDVAHKHKFTLADVSKAKKRIIQKLKDMLQFDYGVMQYSDLAAT